MLNLFAFSCFVSNGNIDIYIFETTSSVFFMFDSQFLARLTYVYSMYHNIFVFFFVCLFRVSAPHVRDKQYSMTDLFACLYPYVFTCFAVIFILCCCFLYFLAGIRQPPVDGDRIRLFMGRPVIQLFILSHCENRT